eukprot:1984009-Amphidinium_carterae.1
MGAWRAIEAASKPATDCPNHGVELVHLRVVSSLQLSSKAVQEHFNGFPMSLANFPIHTKYFSHRKKQVCKAQAKPPKTGNGPHDDDLQPTLEKKSGACQEHNLL